MNNLLAFSFQSALCLSLFYGAYFLLRKDTHFAIKRLYLVLSLVIALLLPIFTIEYEVGQKQQEQWMYLLPEVQIFGASLENNEMIAITLKDIIINPTDITIIKAFARELGWNFNPFLLLFSIYVAGVLLLLSRLVFQSLQFWWLLRRKGVQYINGLKVLISDKHYTPYSYFNIICVNEEYLTNKGIDRILLHESEHIKQKHYIDLLIAELAAIFQWFNPLVWLYESAIKENHEYLADNGVLARGFNKSDYQTLIVNEVLGVPMFGVANNFNHSLIKKRIVMMTRIKSANIAKLKILLMLPIISLLVYAFAKPIYREKTNDVKTIQDTIPEKKKIAKGEEKAFETVDQMPVYQGGTEALMKFIGNNTKYPAEARKQNIQGKVYIRFAVEKDGSIGRVSAVRTVHSLLDEEAVRVVNSMPRWTAGKQEGENVAVWYTIPINFALQSSKKNK